MLDGIKDIHLFDKRGRIGEMVHTEVIRVTSILLFCMVVVMVAFCSHARILGECLTIHSPPVLFSFFFLVEISLRTLISLFTPGLVHSGSAS